MDQTNYEIARELVERYKATDSWGGSPGWGSSPDETQLAVMQASAMLAVVDAIKEGGRYGQGGTGS